VLWTRDHVELLCSSLEFGKKIFEKVARVFRQPCGAIVRLADEATEFFPSTRDYEANHLSMVAKHLILVDGALLTSAHVDT
jgi:hypothetical protein